LRYKAELSSSSAHTKLMPLRYKAELSSSSAHTKLMPLRYKAELSSSSAHTKLMPLRYKSDCVPHTLHFLPNSLQPNGLNKLSGYRRWTKTDGDGPHGARHTLMTQLSDLT